MTDPQQYAAPRWVTRRDFLRGSATVAGAAVAAPLLGGLPAGAAGAPATEDRWLGP